MAETAKLYLRRNGSFGASCDGCADTGHHILEDSGRFAVFSVQDGREGTIIAQDATREDAEAAIALDWRSK